ncbi:MAG: hypothetical protein ACE5GL_07530, partial [Calditrichia bacterium]
RRLHLIMEKSFELFPSCVSAQKAANISGYPPQLSTRITFYKMVNKLSYEWVMRGQNQITS